MDWFGLTEIDDGDVDPDPDIADVWLLNRRRAASARRR